jgi:hypothetical protein
VQFAKKSTVLADKLQMVPYLNRFEIRGKEELFSAVGYLIFLLIFDDQQVVLYCEGGDVCACERLNKTIALGEVDLSRVEVKMEVLLKLLIIYG